VNATAGGTSIAEPDGKRVTNVTPGNFDVVDIAAVDEPGQWLYYIASPDNATQRYLYRTRWMANSPPYECRPAAAYALLPDLPDAVGLSHLLALRQPS